MNFKKIIYSLTFIITTLICDQSFADFNHNDNVCFYKKPHNSHQIYINSNEHLSSIFEMAVIGYIIRNGYKYCDTRTHFVNPYTLAKNLENGTTDIFIGAFMDSEDNNIGWYNLKDKYHLDIPTTLISTISSRWVFPKYILANHPLAEKINSWHEFDTYYHTLEESSKYSHDKETVLTITVPKNTLFYHNGVEVLQKLYLYPKMTTITPDTWDQYNKIVADLYKRKRIFLVQKTSIESFNQSFSFQAIDSKNDIQDYYKQVILVDKNKLPTEIYKLISRITLSDKTINKYVNLLHTDNMRLILLYFLKQEPHIWNQWVPDKNIQKTIMYQVDLDSKILLKHNHNSSIDRIIFHDKSNN